MSLDEDFYILIFAGSEMNYLKLATGQSMKTVPKEEIEKRISRLQTALAADNLDGAFILHNADLYYFSGTIQTAILFVPSNGNPILMVQKNHDRAKLESPLINVIPVKNKNRIPQVLNDFKLDRIATAGLEMDVLPANLYLWFQRIFAQCRWADVSSIIRRLRMLKSDYEIEQIKKATAILHTGLTQIKSVIREGVSELEIDEYPIISPRFDAVLEKGMVLALEPKFVFPNKGVVGLEDDYQVTSNGLERLTQTGQTLIKI